ncbi:MAG: glycosyltransferase family 1 protein [Acidobacteria bacterium]|nr:MAG: glycosyltransferase family 1 protein [Acidobacteriota bacterium]
MDVQLHGARPDRRAAGGGAGGGAGHRLRVCHVITKLELGGAQQNTLYTVRHLDRRRFDPSLIAGPGGVLDEEARRIVGVTFETSPPLRREIRPLDDARALIDLTRRLKRLAPHIVHTHSSKAGILGRAAAFFARVPVIVHTVHGWGFHDGLPRTRRALYVLAEQMAQLLTTRTVAVSEANVRTGVSRDIAPPEAFRVIRSGVELERFRRSTGSGRLREELRVPEGAPLVGMVACLKPQKAPLDFVAVAARVAQAHPTARFVLAGDGELRPEVERAVAAAGLAGRFFLLGWRRDPEIVVGDLDVLVLTSRHEGLPRVIPEAMSAGKPVVATAVDGSPEAVLPGRTGFLRPPGDVEGIAADVSRLLRDPALARRFGRAARLHVRPWDIDEMVRAQERLYLELAREARLPTPAVAAPDQRTVASPVASS